MARGRGKGWPKRSQAEEAWMEELEERKSKNKAKKKEKKKKKKQKKQKKPAKTAGTNASATTPLHLSLKPGMGP